MVQSGLGDGLPVTSDNVLILRKFVANMLHRHASVVPLLHLSTSTDLANGPQQQRYGNLVETFCDEFLSLRIGDRLIGENWLEMANRQRRDFVFPGGDEMIGAIQEVDVESVVRSVVDRVSSLVRDEAGESPIIRVVNTANGNSGSTQPYTIHYIPTHLRFMLFETLKNSAQAHLQNGSKHELIVHIHKILNGVSINITDKGGGVMDMSKIWKYSYSTSKMNQDSKKVMRLLDGSLPPEVPGSVVPLSGFGFGLPLARLYSRYFGGDLTFVNMKGHGSDLYLFLPDLSTQDSLSTVFPEDLQRSCTRALIAVKNHTF
eukprot:GHVH01002137.1.p1 GENE.GHVH01002137.1~~GHVH01002137.1.p1  ORF type:complete len:317 (-),score=36.46 GHVH01002137.1:95-1045(-)